MWTSRQSPLTRQTGEWEQEPSWSLSTPSCWTVGPPHGPRCLSRARKWVWWWARATRGCVWPDFRSTWPRSSSGSWWPAMGGWASASWWAARGPGRARGTEWWGIIAARQQLRPDTSSTADNTRATISRWEEILNYISQVSASLTWKPDLEKLRNWVGKRSEDQRNSRCNI